MKNSDEAALGMSFVGKRALVCMKHVGMNVAAELFRQLLPSQALKGGLIVIADRRSQYALLAERTGQPFLRRFLTDTDVRTKQSAGSV